MQIDLNDYMTLAEVAEALGTNPVGACRAVARCRKEGLTVQATVLGRRMVLRSMLEVIRDHYYPYGSPAHKRMGRVWGHRGGTQKQINIEAAATRIVALMAATPPRKAAKKAAKKKAAKRRPPTA